MDKKFIKLTESNKAIVYLLLSELVNDNPDLKTQHKSFNVKQIGECYVVEEIKSYKLDKKFFEENQEKLEEIYKKFKNIF